MGLSPRIRHLVNKFQSATRSCKTACLTFMPPKPASPRAGDPPERRNAAIDREICRPILSGTDSAERKRPAC